MREVFAWLDSPASDPYWIAAVSSIITFWLVWLIRKIKLRIQGLAHRLNVSSIQREPQKERTLRRGPRKAPRRTSGLKTLSEIFAAEEVAQ